MIKLYDFLPCPFGQKVRIVLAEKSLSHELVSVDFTKGEHRRPEFLRLNPYGRVPVLVDEDTVVYDSTIINEYLDDEYPDPPVLPRIEYSSSRARARIFEDFADTSFTPQVGQLMAEMVKTEAERDQSRLQRLRQTIERVMDYVNRELQGQNFLAGEFSVADIGFVPRLVVLKELGLDVSAGRNNVEAWMKRLLDRPSIQGLEGVVLEPIAGV
ncbi:MAG TPA: glutathione S-transferase family protein [Candidatus Binataceae bacterium]|jgi:glutathione S-transferase|nr:glutathione S-transferase family protein [Candidatus Binataceae bacterium]